MNDMAFDTALIPNVPPIRIDERLRSHIPALRSDEYQQLEENIRRDGCKSPLILWGDVLLDGHNRYQICQKWQIPFSTETVSLPDFDAAEAWIEENQLGRRNLTADQFSYYIGKKYERLKKAQGAPEGNVNRSIQTHQNDGVEKPRGTAAVVAEQHGIGQATVERAHTYARNVDTAAAVFGDEARSILLSGEDKLTRRDVADISRFAADAKEHDIGFDGLTQAIALANDKENPEELIAHGEDEILELAGRIRTEKAKARREQNEAIRQANPLPVVEGKYGTIVIDPPWGMKKIDRDARPNQVEFDYPTMDEDELAAFPVADMAADDCHLFCWTTQKYMPVTLRLFDAWGFKYVLQMVWNKTGGFQPFGLPQYNCEFVLYGRKGSPEFVDTKAFPTCFSAPRREHSRKPDEFYDLIRRVTAEGRIDVFSREKRDGFAQFGNEIAKFDDCTADDDDGEFDDCTAPADSADVAVEAEDNTGRPHVSHNTGNNEWHTPARYVEAARAVLGSIDLDPASNEIANRTVQATQYYTAHDDGLTQPWHGNVWLNPPYSYPLISRFMERLVNEVAAGNVTQALCLTNNATEVGWFQMAFTAASAVCFPRTRVKFTVPDTGNGGSPLQGQAFFYFGTNVAAFANAFRDIGTICQVINTTKARLADDVAEAAG